MRVALFGGSFDPPHCGHVALARLARERLALDRVLVAPVGAQPLKQDQGAASFADRVAMAGLAFAGEPKTEISLLDAPRADNQSNYTLGTLNTIKGRLSGGDKLFCILGADSLLSIRKWHRPTDLLMTCDFIVGARPGFDLNKVKSALPDDVTVNVVAKKLSNTQLLELTTGDGRQACLYWLADLEEDASATKIRADLQRGRGDEWLIPPVLQYIRTRRLYGASIK